MNLLVIQILAVGLTLSQLFTMPEDKFRKSFDPVTDKAEIERLLGSGCDFLLKDFKAEEIDFEALFSLLSTGGKKADVPSETDEDDDIVFTQPQKTGKSFMDKMVEKLDPPTLYAAYKQFCRKEKVENSPVKLDEVVKFYNTAIGVLPDHKTLKGMKLPEASVIVDGDGNKFTEVYKDDNRRKWVKIKDLPPYVKNAFVAAEDQRFYSHKGVDLRGLIRAFSSNLSGENGNRPQGGSTITQQVIKNLLVGDDLKFERKIREMVLAVWTENLLSKDEILELYLNFVFLGRASWGIEMASQSYFGKPAKKLTPAEAALLATLPKGPTVYNPDRNPDKSKERYEYVLGRMLQDKYIDQATFAAASHKDLPIIAWEPPRTRGGFYYVDEIVRQAKTLPGVGSLTERPFKVYSTLNPKMQKTAEMAMIDNLEAYEKKMGRQQFEGPEGSIAKLMEKPGTSWEDAFAKVRPKRFDIHWTPAVVLKRDGDGTKVGLQDGRIARLKNGKNSLNVFDIIFVELQEGNKTKKVKVDGKKTEKKVRTLTATMRIPPIVQGAVVVLENKTGRVLAMVGGSSYGASQLNRVTQASRPPGSTLKPFIYLAALQQGYQPNTLISDRRVVISSVHRGGAAFIPGNYDGKSHGTPTMRTALENSYNKAAVRMAKNLGESPIDGLVYIQGITQELGIYKETDTYFPWLLGFRDVRPLDMAVAYATIANDGLMPTAHFIDVIEERGKRVYEREYNLVQPESVDRVSFYQLKNILRGVVTHGTAKAAKEELGGFVGGKTGTSSDFRDAWFIGFTNDITIATWIGYDRKRELGSGNTGGGTALPIAKTIFMDSFVNFRPAEELTGPPDAIKKQIVERAIEVKGGDIIWEAFRKKTRKKQASEYLDLNPDNEEFADSGPEENDTANAEYSDYPDQMTSLELDGGDFYQPGDEDMNDVWRRRGRQIDPIFN